MLFIMHHKKRAHFISYTTSLNRLFCAFDNFSIIRFRIEIEQSSHGKWFRFLPDNIHRVKRMNRNGDDDED